MIIYNHNNPRTPLASCVLEQLVFVLLEEGFLMRPDTYCANRWPQARDFAKLLLVTDGIPTHWCGVRMDGTQSASPG